MQLCHFALNLGIEFAHLLYRSIISKPILARNIMGAQER